MARCQNVISRFLPLVLPLLGALSSGAAVQAQVPPRIQQQTLPPGAQSALQGMTREQIREQIRSSGLTQAQIRDRLSQAGYDPSLADPYFEQGVGGSTGASPADSHFLEVMRSVGLSLRSPMSDTVPSVGADTSADAADSLGVSQQGAPTSLPVFGRSVFLRRTTEFDAVLTGPVGPGYRLGPGDELLLVLTGDVELAYRLDVTREGLLVIPDVGQVSVNGLTLGQLEDRLYDRLGQVYSGVRRGGDATTHFNVSLGRLRTNQVYVVGAVERPGAYQVSSVATVLEALYAAGGPQESGSFRNIYVRRGGQTVGSFDLYRYLTAGETPTDLRLEQGDVVFVPSVGLRVSLRGEVWTPARFELLPGEGIPDLIAYAGGLKPDAREDVVQVRRILPVGERQEGKDRTLIDVDLATIRSGAGTFELMGGDEVEVHSLLEEQRDWVAVTGAVYRPGRYELTPGATVSNLINRAGGALPDVLDPVVHVSRLRLQDGKRVLIRTSLQGGEALPLAEFDQVTVFGRDSLLAPDSVGVYGFVNKPGKYPLSMGASAEDAVLLAGGLAYGADPRLAEVVTTVQGAGDGVITSSSRRVGLSSELPEPGPFLRDSLGPLPAALPPAESVALENGDEVYVRAAPDFRELRRVQVVGEVLTPGTYVLQRMDERLSSVLARAGGLTSQAFPEGFRLIRDSITVGVDLLSVLASPGGRGDPVLADGDRLVVPVSDATVLVRGAVEFDTRVVYRPGMGLGDAISAAGGTRPGAEKSRISVEYANGSRSTVKRFLGLTYSTPDVRPGSTVFVPTRPESSAGFDWNSALTRILAVTSTMATLIIAIHR